MAKQELPEHLKPMQRATYIVQGVGIVVMLFSLIMAWTAPGVLPVALGQGLIYGAVATLLVSIGISVVLEYRRRAWVLDTKNAAAEKAHSEESVAS